MAGFLDILETLAPANKKLQTTRTSLETVATEIALVEERLQNLILRPRDAENGVPPAHMVQAALRLCVPRAGTKKEKLHPSLPHFESLIEECSISEKVVRKPVQSRIHVAKWSFATTRGDVVLRYKGHPQQLKEIIIELHAFAKAILTDLEKRFKQTGALKDMIALFDVSFQRTAADSVIPVATLRRQAAFHKQDDVIMFQGAWEELQSQKEQVRVWY